MWQTARESEQKENREENVLKVIELISRNEFVLDNFQVLNLNCELGIAFDWHFI